MITTDETTTDLTGAGDRPPADRRDRPNLGEATSVVTFGHLAWLGWTWLVAAFVYTVVIVAVAIWGEVDHSLWQSIFAGWQRFVLFASGVTTITTFLRIFLRNGATRRLLWSASMAGMGLLAVAGGLLITLGWAVEKVVYDAQGWTQTLNGGGVFEWSDLWRVVVEAPLVLAAYFLSGWLVGAGFYQYGLRGGLALLLPGLLPAVLSELATSKDFGGIDIDVLPDGLTPALAVTVAAGVAIVVGSAAVARRVTLAVPMR